MSVATTSIDLDDAMLLINQELEKQEWSPAQELLDSGIPASYESDEYPGLLLQEFPDGRLFSVDIDIKSGEVIYLKQLK